MSLLGSLLVGSAMVGVACSDEESSTPPPGAPDAAGLNLPEASTPSTPSPPTDAGTNTGPVDAGYDAAAAKAVEGYYTGDWGQIMLRAVGDEVWGTYVHDQGTVRGRMVAPDKFVGWWCEAPTRMGPTNAGDAEFLFLRGDAGEDLSLDGRWLYAREADAGAWREDWDVKRVTTAPPQILIDRFNDPSVFCPHP